jgi:DNA repair photolyase
VVEQESEIMETPLVAEFKSFLKKVEGNEGSKCKYSTRLDVYGCGCGHDCSYCYAKSLLEFRGLWKPENPAVADVDKVLKMVPKLSGVTRLGGMTDCFQPCEEKHRVTLQVLEEMREFRKPYLIVTKSPLVAADEYMRVMTPELAHIQISVTSTDPEISARYEKAFPPEARIAAIEKLAAAGYDVQIRVSPFVPEWIDPKRINAIKCDKILVEFLRVNQWMRFKFKGVNLLDYTVNEHGYYHLPLEEKIRLLSWFEKPQISVCEDTDEAFQYFKTKVNHNPDDCCNLRVSGGRG